MHIKDLNLTVSQIGRQMCGARKKEKKREKTIDRLIYVHHANR